MDETQPYNAILETYTKQETPLEEKKEQFDKLFSEYQDAIKRLEKNRKHEEDDSLKVHQKVLTKIGRMQCVSGICKLTGLTWEQTQQKQNKLHDSKIKIRSAAENNKNKYQETSQDLKHLKMDYLQENISTKIEDYQSKTKNVDEIGKGRWVEYQNLNLTAITSSYKISSALKEQRKKKLFEKNLTQISEQIKKVKKNIESLNAKAKELDEKD